jgi:hypothetical protein
MGEELAAYDRRMGVKSAGWTNSRGFSALAAS